jgi:hypothetical protein
MHLPMPDVMLRYNVCTHARSQSGIQAFRQSYGQEAGGRRQEAGGRKVARL